MIGGRSCGSGSDYWPWFGSTVFPVASFRASFGLRILPWRIPRTVGPEHALDVQPVAAPPVDLLASRRDRQPAVSTLRITVGRFLGCPEVTTFTGIAGRRKLRYAEVPAGVIDFFHKASSSPQPRWRRTDNPYGRRIACAMMVPRMITTSW